MNHTCQWLGCESKKLVGRGLCQRCYMRAKRSGRLAEFKAPDRECIVCGSTFAITKHRKACCSEECTKRRGGVELMRHRLASLPDRDCAYCLEPIPTQVRRDAQHCSGGCQQARWYVENAEMLRARTAAWNREHEGLRRSYRHARRAAKYAAGYERFDAWEIGDRDRWICNLCGDPIDQSLRHPEPLSKSIDHVIPLSKGGSHSRANVAITHLVCNIKKEDRLQAVA